MFLVKKKYVNIWQKSENKVSIWQYIWLDEIPLEIIHTNNINSLFGRLSASL